MKQSPRFTWNKADTQKMLKEAWEKSIPYLVVILPVVIGQIPKDWAYSAIVLFILQRLYSAIKLYSDGPVKK